jgi:hypothetical protein
MCASTVTLNMTCGAICTVVGMLWMIRYIDEWIGEERDTSKYEGEGAVDAGHQFFGKNEEIVIVRKTIIFLTNICFVVSLHVRLELLLGSSTPQRNLENCCSQNHLTKYPRN